jgi:uncharacterized membrane protein YheB (UPF0754 family)
MLLEPMAWIAIPVLGGVIGYGTNRLAVKMVFRPIEPVNILGLRVQGLVGRRQADLAENIGRVVGDHLLEHDDIVAALEKVDLEQLIGDAIDGGLGPKLAELRRMPLIGGFLTDERIGDLRESVIRGVLANKEGLIESFEKAIEQGLDVSEVVAKKVSAFPVERLEELVLSVASQELRAIEVLGGVLGLLIGLVQVGVLAIL